MLCGGKGKSGKGLGWWVVVFLTAEKMGPLNSLRKGRIGD
jgi:hypothetical protein